MKCNNGLKWVQPIFEAYIKVLKKPAAKADPKCFYAPLYNNHKLLIRFIFDRDGVENVEML